MIAAAIRTHVAHHRLVWSRFFGLTLLIAVAFSAPPWDSEGGAALAVEFSGYVLLVVATLLRLWCVTYIGGIKDSRLVTEGPYSVVRNPLYVSSFLGGVGFGLSVENPIATAVIFVVFMVFYPAVVRREERVLTEKFGSTFADYTARVPRWWPDWSNYHEPSEYVIRPRYLRKAYINAMWFMWAFILWEIIEKLQHLGIVPVLWGGLS